MNHPAMTDDLLENWLKARLLSGEIEDLSIVDSRRLAQGHSNDTSLVEIVYKELGVQKKQKYVFRLDIVHGISEPYDIPKEFRLLQALQGTEVAAPTVHWMEEAPSTFGPAFYVMEFCDGTVADELYESGDYSGLIGQASPAARRSISEAYYREIAKIHKVDWSSLGLGEMARPKGGGFNGTPQRDTTEAAERALQEWEWRARKESLMPEPALIPALAALKSKLPRCQEITFLHGDCKISNYMFKDNKVTGVLDWEWSRIGDPMNDLAWCLPEPEKTMLDGLLNFNEAREVYESESGIKVDNDRLNFYQGIRLLKIYAFATAMGRLIEQGQSHDLRYIGLTHYAHQALVGLSELRI